MADHDEYDDFMDDPACPKCDGAGSVECYCGGDLCVCTYYGDRPCPLCNGEGSVSDARHEQYLAAQRASWAAYQAAVNAKQHHFTKVAPWKMRSQKPATTTKRAKVKAARKQRQRNA